MDPNTTIRPWLLGCGKYFGANEAHEYDWPDVSARPEVRHFTYEVIEGNPDPGRPSRKDEKSGDYDVIKSGEQEWTISARITLYNDPEGFDDLAGCVIATAEQEFLDLFKRNSTAYLNLVYLRNLTTRNDDRVYYKHEMVCRFKTKLGYYHFRKNEVVTEVILDDPFGQD